MDWTVPRRVDKEKKNPVVDKDSLRGLAPEFNRGEAVFERNTLKIVEINVFRNELLNFGTQGKVSAVQAFGFQGAEEVFHRSIVVGAARAGHGRRNMVFLSQVEVCLGRVLRPLVTGECESTSDLFLFQSLTDRVCDQRRRHIGADLPHQNNLTAQVQHCAHVQHTAGNRNVSKGGLTREDNLQTLCWKCNRSKGAKTVFYRT